LPLEEKAVSLVERIPLSKFCARVRVFRYFLDNWGIITKNHLYFSETKTENHLIQQLNTTFDNHDNRIKSILQKISDPGVIALILVLTSAYLFVIKGVSDIPETLKAMLLTIVGFYFGSMVKQKTEKHEN
jgi:hypothetical protein